MDRAAILVVVVLVLWRTLWLMATRIEKLEQDVKELKDAMR
jgi:predicted Holliday junction resolvase-like endonuclease